MSAYVVVQAGTYRHAIIGVFTDQMLARDAAITAIRAERDDYHNYEVLRFEADTPVDDGELVCAMTRYDGQRGYALLRTDAAIGVTEVFPDGLRVVQS